MSKNYNESYQGTSYCRGFLPRTFIEWVTLITLFCGIVASLYSSIIKPYRYIIQFDRALVEDNRRITMLEKQCEKIEKLLWELKQRGF